MPTKAANVNNVLSADFYSGIEEPSIPDCHVFETKQTTQLRVAHDNACIINKNIIVHMKR